MDVHSPRFPGVMHGSNLDVLICIGLHVRLAGHNEQRYVTGV